MIRVQQIKHWTHDGSGGNRRVTAVADFVLNPNHVVAVEPKPYGCEVMLSTGSRHELESSFDLVVDLLAERFSA